MVFFSIFCGSPVLNNYSAEVFKSSGSTMNPKTSACVMITIQVLATIIASSLVDCIGRRILLIVSCFGTALGLAAMGTFNYFSVHSEKGAMDSFNWIPIFSVSFTVLTAYTGLLPLVFVIILEVLPAKVIFPLCLSSTISSSHSSSSNCKRFVSRTQQFVCHASVYLCSSS